MPAYLRDDLIALGVSDRPIFVPTPAQLTISAAELDFRKVKRIARHAHGINGGGAAKLTHNFSQAPLSDTMGALLQRKLFINAVDTGRRTWHAKTPSKTNDGSTLTRIMMVNTASPVRPVALPPSPASVRSPCHVQRTLRPQQPILHTTTTVVSLAVDAAEIDSTDAAMGEPVALNADTAASCVKMLRAATFCVAFITQLRATHQQAWNRLRGVVERWRRMGHRLASRTLLWHLVVYARAKAETAEAEALPPRWGLAALKVQRLARAYVHITRARLEALQRAWLRQLSSRRSPAVNDSTYRAHAAPALLQILRDARKRHVAAAAGNPTTQVQTTAFTPVHDVALVLAYVRGHVTRDINVIVATTHNTLLLFTDPTVRAALDTLRREVVPKLKAGLEKVLTTSIATPVPRPLRQHPLAAHTAAVRKAPPTPKEVRTQTVDLVKTVNAFLRKKSTR